MNDFFPLKLIVIGSMTRYYTISLVNQKINKAGFQLSYSFSLVILLPKSFVFIVHVFAFVVYCSSILLQGI